MRDFLTQALPPGTFGGWFGGWIALDGFGCLIGIGVDKNSCNLVIGSLQAFQDPRCFTLRPQGPGALLIRFSRSIDVSFDGVGCLGCWINPGCPA